MYIRVAWDPLKAADNYRKHGVAFVDAERALADDRAIVITDDRFDEQRFIAIGVDSSQRILVVSYTYPSNTEELRIISARKATPREQRQYYGQQK